MTSSSVMLSVLLYSSRLTDKAEFLLLRVENKFTGNGKGNICMSGNFVTV